MFQKNMSEKQLGIPKIYSKYLMFGKHGLTNYEQRNFDKIRSHQLEQGVLVNHIEDIFNYIVHNVICIGIFISSILLAFAILCVFLEYNKIGNFRLYKILQDKNERIPNLPQPELDMRQGFEEAYKEFQIMVNDIMSGQRSARLYARARERWS